jgi:hypothetical protein
VNTEAEQKRPNSDERWLEFEQWILQADWNMAADWHLEMNCD